MGWFDFLRPAPAGSARPEYAAATQGDRLARLGLGRALILGLDGHTQVGEGMKWLFRAAHQGQPQAQLLLGVGFALGAGVPFDQAEALAWITLAEAGLPPLLAPDAAAYRQTLLADLTPEDRSRGETRSAELNEILSHLDVPCDIEVRLAAIVFSEPAADDPCHQCLRDALDMLDVEGFVAPAPPPGSAPNPASGGGGPVAAAQTLVCSAFRRQAFAGCTTPQAVFDLVTECLVKDVRASRATVFEYSPDLQLFAARTHVSPDGTTRLAQLDRTLATRLADRSFVAALPAGVATWEEARALPALSLLLPTEPPAFLLLAPLADAERVLGLVQVEMLSDRQVLATARQALAEMTAVAGPILGRLLPAD